MEDYIVAKIVRRAITSIVGVLIFCSLIYGWWIGDYSVAFKTVYVEPMQHVVGLAIQPKLNRLENSLERIASTTDKEGDFVHSSAEPEVH
jgi:hypothetical protein